MTKWFLAVVVAAVVVVAGCGDGGEASATWYVQVGALIAGHVAGLVVAHDKAVTIFRERGTALCSQLSILVLMVLYTGGGLWVLSRG